MEHLHCHWYHFLLFEVADVLLGLAAVLAFDISHLWAILMIVEGWVLVAPVVIAESVSEYKLLNFSIIPQPFPLC